MRTFALTLCHHVFFISGSMLEIYFTLLGLKTGNTMLGLVLKDSDMESENLNALIRLSVSDGQKT